LRDREICRDLWRIPRANATGIPEPYFAHNLYYVKSAIRKAANQFLQPSARSTPTQSWGSQRQEDGVFAESAEKVQLRVAHPGIGPSRIGLTAAFRFRSRRRLRLSSTAYRQNIILIATEPSEFLPVWSECDLLTPFFRGFRALPEKSHGSAVVQAFILGRSVRIFDIFTGICRALLGA
jgi:hypothetical protein